MTYLNCPCSSCHALGTVMRLIVSHMASLRHRMSRIPDTMETYRCQPECTQTMVRCIKRGIAWDRSLGCDRLQHAKRSCRYINRRLLKPLGCTLIAHKVYCCDSAASCKRPPLCVRAPHAKNTKAACMGNPLIVRTRWCCFIMW